MAVPSEEPRLEMLRDRPEISPCRLSGKADCTTLTEGVSISPRPSPISSSPGVKAQMSSTARTSSSRTRMPAVVVANPVTIRVRWDHRFASRSAPSEEASRPRVAAVKTPPVAMAL